MTMTISGSGTITGLTAGGLPDATITQPELTTAVIPLGLGQTWQNVTGSRADATNYTNSTGRPIFVSIQCSNTGSTGSTGLQGNVDGNTVCQNVGLNGIGTGNIGFSVAFIVPNGSTYSLTLVNSTLYLWNELR